MPYLICSQFNLNCVVASGRTSGDILTLPKKTAKKDLLGIYFL